MCQNGVQSQVTMMNNHCECGCSCPVLLPVGDEIRRLEEHKRIISARIEAIDRKIAALKTVKEQ